ncbi:metal-dependent hydrolase [Granulicella sp. WH15]|uniref:metal-dependent hydrolase n=1 Tax=Granulicella sp. WH15 TaxID=2602070 RepID=UPI0013675F88|nr:metal-dependent hydrolase [Granulicella sp. WH15]QHN04654.1 metal-dependent hydrolase [Granulicella sp. WH15]
MEPVTHVLTGALLARTGFNRRAAYATAAMAIAAELPDIDTLWSLTGPIPGFEHHRGITHTFVGVPFEAALLTAAFCFVHRRRSKPTKAPVNWPFLYFATLIALLSHLFLDWTNNYGLRPFFPFNPRWYSGSFVFIFEPILFVLLLIGLLAPKFLGTVQTWAIAALLAICALWGFRFHEHSRALQIAATTTPAPLFASPSPIDPFTWHVVADTPAYDQLSTVNTRTGTSAPGLRINKAAPTVATLVAKRSPLAEPYLDWSALPLVDQGAVTPDGLTPVTFRDARFLGSIPPLDARHRAPLSGTVFVDLAADDAHRIARMELDGRVQR